MLVLKSNVENLQHYKNLKIAEEKELRQKIKKVEKKLKQVTEKEAMIQVEKDQMARNMVKYKKVSSGSSTDMDETNNNTVDNHETSKVDDSKSDDNSIEEMSKLAIDPETTIPSCERKKDRGFTRPFNHVKAFMGD
jgi:hypothetical protein